MDKYEIGATPAGAIGEVTKDSENSDIGTCTSVHERAYRWV
jgi:hypothetical protein